MDQSRGKEEEEAVRQIQSLSVASAPSPPLPFERESSRTFFSRNQSILARHPLKSLLLLLRLARVPLIDLIEERSSFHEICTNRGEQSIGSKPPHYSQIWFSATLFPELLHRNSTSILQQ